MSSVTSHAQTLTTDNKLVISYQADNEMLEIGRVDRWTKLTKPIAQIPEAQFGTFDEALGKLQDWAEVAETNSVTNFEKSLRLVWGTSGNLIARDFSFKVSDTGEASVYTSGKFGPDCDDEASGSSFGCMTDPGAGTGIWNFEDVADIRELIADMDNFKAQGSPDALFK